MRIPPFVNHKGNDVNSDWLADQWDERSLLGHAQFHKGRMKGDDPEVDTAQTPKRFDRRLALLGKTRKTFTDSIPNKEIANFCLRICGNRAEKLRKCGIAYPPVTPPFGILSVKVFGIFPRRDRRQSKRFGVCAVSILGSSPFIRPL